MGYSIIPSRPAPALLPSDLPCTFPPPVDLPCTPDRPTYPRASPEPPTLHSQPAYPALVPPVDLPGCNWPVDVLLPLKLLTATLRLQLRLPCTKERSPAPTTWRASHKRPLIYLHTPLAAHPTSRRDKAPKVLYNYTQSTQKADTELTVNPGEPALYFRSPALLPDDLPCTPQPTYPTLVSPTRRPCTPKPTLRWLALAPSARPALPLPTDLPCTSPSLPTLHLSILPARLPALHFSQAAYPALPLLPIGGLHPPQATSLLPIDLPCRHLSPE